MKWRELTTAGRIEAIKGVWAPKMSARMIAESIGGITRQVVAAMYFRYPDQLANHPLMGEHGRWMRDRAHNWTQAEIERVAQMLREHKSGAAIATELGVTCDMVASIVRRTPELKAIGYSARATNRMTAGERAQRKREAWRRWKERQRHNEPSKPFKPVLVHQNLNLMVQDFMAKNGVRKFERGASAEYHSLEYYLRERGYTLVQRATRYTLRGPSGRPREVSYRQAVEIADRFRMAEGLEPFLAA